MAGGSGENPFSGVKANVSVGDTVFANAPLDAARDLRMKEVVEHGLRNVRDVTTEIDELKLPGQDFCVLCTLPQREGSTTVSLRISAVFKEQDKAEEHARRLSERYPAYDVSVIVVGGWCVFPAPITEDFAEIRRHVNAELDAAMRSHFEQCKAQREGNDIRRQIAREESAEAGIVIEAKPPHDCASCEDCQRERDCSACSDCGSGGSGDPPAGHDCASCDDCRQRDCSACSDCSGGAAPGAAE